MSFIKRIINYFKIKKVRKNYVVIRKAEGQGFKSNSYAKVVEASKLKPTNYNPIALLNGIPVYIQNTGTKEYCEKIQKRIKDILDYKNIGEDW